MAQFDVDFSPSVLEITSRPPSPTSRILLVLLVAAITTALAWSYLSKVEIVAGAEAKSVPTQRVKSIQSPERAIVRRIHVRDGHVVKAKDVLLTLDTEDLDFDIRSSGHKLEVARMTIARLEAKRESVSESDVKRRLLTPPDGVSERIAREHLILYDSEFDFLEVELDRIAEEVLNSEEEIRFLGESKKLTEEIIDVLQERLNALEGLLDKGITTKRAYQELRQEIIENRRQLAKTIFETSKNRSKIIDLMYEKSSILSKATMDATTELVATEKEAGVLQNELAKLRERRQNRILRSPIDGTVEEVSVHTVSGVVEPAEKVMSVVPFDNALEFESRVLNKDIGFIEVGQQVNIKLDAFPFERYGVATGIVTGIAKDAMETEENDWVYIVRCTPDRPTFLADGQEVTLTSGMTATVDIVTGERSVLSFLVEPVIRHVESSLRER